MQYSQIFYKNTNELNYDNNILKNYINNSILKLNVKDNPILNIEYLNYLNQINQNDILKNKLLSNVSTSEIILYWTFKYIYPRNKETFMVGNDIAKINLLILEKNNF